MHTLVRQRAIAQTGAPATEPVTLAEAKAHLRVTESDDDTYITTLTEAAREYCENYVKRQFVTATYTLTMDAFPLSGGAIQIPRPPLQSVTSITYTDTAGDGQTWSSTEYSVDAPGAWVGRVVEANSESYPSTLDELASVVVTFVAGYGAAAAVPSALKQAILILVSHWYCNREPVVIGTIVSGEIPFTVTALLNTYKVFEAD